MTDKKQQTWREWLEAVNDLCEDTFDGLALDFFPGTYSLNSRDAFNNKRTPQEFFAEDVIPQIRAEFGEDFVKAFLQSEPHHAIIAKPN